MKSKIVYETDGKHARVELESSGEELIKGCCRILVNVQEQMKIDDEDFEKLIAGGCKIVKLEKRVNENPELEKILDVLTDLLDGLSK